MVIKIIGVAILLLMLCVAFFGENGFVDMMKRYRTVEQLETEVEEARNENLKLWQRIEALKSKDNKEVERIAREDLGMVGEGEAVFQFSSLDEKSGDREEDDQEGRFSDDKRNGAKQ